MDNPEPVAVRSCATWDEVPGSRERQPDSVVRVTLSTHTGSVDLYLGPGDAICDGWDEPSAIEVCVLEPDPESESDGP